MKELFIAIFAALSVLVLGGCATVQSNTTDTTVGEKVPSATLKAGEELLLAFVANDGDKFTKLLSPELQEKFGDKQFGLSRTELVKSLGEPISFEYVTRVNNPLVEVDIWKVHFKRILDDQKVIYPEALFRVISGDVNGQNRIISFNFF